MKNVNQIRKITVQSKKEFSKECDRINEEIIAAATDRHNKVIMNSPIEIADKIRDEFRTHGFKVKSQSGTEIKIEW